MPSDEVPLPKEENWTWTFGRAQLGWWAPKDRERGLKPDPSYAGQLRYWDGENWTRNIHGFHMQGEGWLELRDDVRRASES
jgi:hypothetical protein